VRITVIAVGKVKQAALRAATDEYLRRIRRYSRCEEIEIKDGSDAEVAGRFRKAVGKRARVVALAADGVQWSSERFARLLAQCENDGVDTLAFLIGGAYGLPAPVLRLADLRLSLSSMTLPHRIARLVLAEQVYRAYTIVRNEPYSH
jgi:23S rRNA (pseudouridine1915-N3)-methyltransferase